MSDPTPEERAAALAQRVLEDSSSDLFVYEKWTAQAIREAVSSSRKKALEEAVKLCEGESQRAVDESGRAWRYVRDALHEVAEKIRALAKEESPRGT